jgi:hypothetical protein
MAKLNGTNLLLYIQMEGAGPWIPILAAQNHSISIDVDLPDASTKGSGGFDEHIPGMRSASGDIDILYDPSEEYNKDQIWDMISNRKGAKIRSSTAETGYKFFEFNASLSNFSENADMEQPVSFSCSFKSNGIIEYKTVPSA